MHLVLVVFLCCIFILEHAVDGEALSQLTEKDIDELLSETNSDGSKAKVKIGIKCKFKTHLEKWKTELKVPMESASSSHSVLAQVKSNEESGRFQNIHCF